MDPAAGLEPEAEDARENSPSPMRQLSLWPPPRSTRRSTRRRRQVTAVTVAALIVLLLAGGIAAALAMGGGDSVEGPEGEAHAEVIVGSWAGEMSQVDTEGEHVADWHAEVRIDEGAEHGGTAWTTFSCSGTLELSAREGDRFVYAYTETTDPGERCVDEAELTVSPGAGGAGLTTEWSSVTREGTQMISTGTMN